MQVYFDESGDCGLRFDRGSSPFLTVTAVILNTPEDAAHCEERIARVAASLQFNSGREFHFADSSDRVRQAFFGAMEECRFAYYSFVLNKRKLWHEGFSVKESMYKYPTGLLFENIGPVLRDAVAVFDRCGNREFRGQLRRYVRRRVGAGCLQSLTMRNSQSCPLLQLADMVCGAVARSFSGNKDGGKYRLLIRAKERQVRFWPP